MIVPDEGTTTFMTSSASPTNTNQDPPKVLVLLAAYNGEQWISDQIRSIFSQEKVQVHIAIRDDGSTDKTVLTAQELAHDGSITITSASASSGSASQNFFELICDNAADAFDFVAFSDQDDVWDPEKLHRACQALKSSGAAAYSSAVTAFWKDGSTRLLQCAIRQTHGDFLFEGAGQGCTYILTAAFYCQARNFVLNHRFLALRIYFHDWAIYALARAWNLPWLFDPKSTMRYRQHEKNVFGARKGTRAIIRRLSLIRSGWYKAQLRAIAELCSTAAPQSQYLSKWHQLCLQPDNFGRRLRLAYFVFFRGRRQRIDQAVLLVSAIAGWI